MKYFLLIFLFACSQPSKNGKNVVVIDSLPMVEGTMSERTRDSIRATWADPGSFTDLKYYRISISTDSGTLGYEQDSTITITGDTMYIIRRILETIERANEREMKLYEEKEELIKVIERLINQEKEIHFTSKLTQRAGKGAGKDYDTRRRGN